MQALEKAAQAQTSATAASGKVSAALNTVEEILSQLCEYRHLNYVHQGRD